MKRKHAIATAILGALALAPADGRAADLWGGLGGEVEFDSNARRTKTNEQKDVIFRIYPWVEVREDNGKFNYDVRYRFPWEKAIEVQRVDGFRHFLNARGEYNFSERTVVSLVNNFSRADSVNSIAGVDDGVSTINTFAEPINRNNMTLALQHSFTPRLQTSANFTWRLFDSDLRQRANNQTYGLNLGSNYQVTSRHRAGGGVAVNYQDFDRSNDGSRTPSQTLFANVYGSWSWLIDETTTFEITAGPTFIDSNQDAAQSTSFQDSIPFVQTGEDGSIVVNDLGSCTTETIEGSTVQILPGGALVCPRFALVGEDGYSLSTGTSETWAGGGYDAGLAQQDIQSIVGAQGASELSFFPGKPTSLSSTSWTIFAEMSLTKRWTPNLLSTASYSRRDSTASGIAGSAVIDFVTLLTTWQISELWNASFRADWTQRESTSPVDQLVLVVDDSTGAATAPPLTSGAFDPNGIFTQGVAYNASYTTRKVNQSIDTTRWGLQARIRRRITRNLSSGLRYTFNRQSSRQGTAGGFSDFNDHLVTWNVQYDFDRWTAW